VILALTIGGVLLLAMICVSVYGWVTLPADARVPIHFRVSYNNFVPKLAGLIVHPALGAVIFVILAVTGHVSSANDGSSHGPSYVAIPIVLALLLVVQIGAIRVARRNSGADRTG
jgi:hypothetical protein